MNNITAWNIIAKDIDIAYCSLFICINNRNKLFPVIKMVIVPFLKKRISSTSNSLLRFPNGANHKIIISATNKMIYRIAMLSITDNFLIDNIAAIIVKHDIIECVKVFL